MAAKAPGARRPKQEEPEKPVNQERYMLTYSDMITLLMTFFVVMYAMSNADKAKYEAVAESLSSAFNNPGVQAESGGGGHSLSPTDTPLRAAPGTGLAPKQSPKKTPFSERATSTLASSIKNGSIRINTEARGVVLGLAGDAFFAKGSADLSEGVLDSIEKVAELVREMPNQIVVEGHTDASPVDKSDKYGSNLMLSAARAVSVAQALELLGVPKERLSATGYGDSKPARPNDTPEGRAFNRRVEVLIRFDAE